MSSDNNLLNRAIVTHQETETIIFQGGKRKKLMILRARGFRPRAVRKGKGR